MNSIPEAALPVAAEPQLVRGVGLGGAVALNMIDMIGVGPFITLPLIIGAMGGPQAMLGWILGALFAACDGMIWAELGAAFPGSGGSYRYISEIYGRHRLGRLLSFLFVWQLSFSAPLSIASGCIGLALYAGYLWPGLQSDLFVLSIHSVLPWVGTFDFGAHFSGTTGVAIAACLLAILLLYRGISSVSLIAKFLWVGVIATVGWVIFAGLSHFHRALAFDFPPGAFTLSRSFFLGLGAAMLVATYDYWGYYNVCFLGGEVKDPERNIPRALLISILAVACIYIVMNISIIGVLPWRELDLAAKTDTRFYVISTFMQRIYGQWAGNLVSVLIMWTAFASVFSLLLGYSRVPYTAALDGNYFKSLRRLHPVRKFPDRSLLALGFVAVMFCMLRLADVIAALVVIRIMVQFLVQAVGIIVLRSGHPEAPRPFRMWLYPAPAVLAIAGFLYVMIARPHFFKEVRLGLIIIVIGLMVYFARAARRPKWPFATGL